MEGVRTRCVLRDLPAGGDRSDVCERLDLAHNGSFKNKYKDVKRHDSRGNEELWIVFFRSDKETDVYQVLTLAEEYQVPSLIQQCKTVLFKLLQKDPTLCYPYEKQLERCIIILSILSTAELYGYTDLHERSISAISQYGSRSYIKPSQQHNQIGYQSNIEIRKSFSMLSVETRYKVLQARLNRCDDNEFKSKS